MGISEGHVQKGLQECVCTSAIAVPSDLLSPTPSASSSMKLTENSKEDPGNPEPVY
jgi:hypothetical protein